MKIQNVSGCTSFSLNVDGKEEIEMTSEERLKVIDNIYEWMKRHPDDILNGILLDLTEAFGEYKTISQSPCECCGDYVEEYVLDLND